MSSRTPVMMQTPFSSRFIRAGAGAGKTTTLIKTFFEFVEHHKVQNEKLPKVIITTFTRKATQEVKERLLLQAISLNDPELFQYINKKSQVHISTIHGVLSLLLNKSHDLLGLSSDIQISDAKTLYKIYYRELKNLFKKHSEYFELLEHYNFKDLVGLAIKFHEQSNEHSLKFVDQNLLKQIRHEKILKARQDLKTILSIKGDMQGHKQWGSYFDFMESFAQTLSDDSVNFETLMSVFESKPKKPNFYVDKPAFDSDIHEIIAKYFSSKADFIPSLDTDDFMNTHQAVNEMFHIMASKFHDQMTDRKMKSGQISIADLESLSLKLIRLYPNEVKSFADQYDYFMVDEYQDTSPLQVAILNALIGLKSQFIVGDPQQSIYLFRGARSEVFLKKETEAKAEKHELISLQTNYRSDHKLMNCINDITSQFSKQFAPMVPKIAEANEYDTQAYYVKTDDDYSGLVHHIKMLSEKGVPFNDICVLLTKNSDIFDFAKFAVKNNIPVQSQIAAGFDKKREIIDLVAFLKFLVNPHDNLNLHILLRSPWFNMTDSEIYNIRHTIDKTAVSFWTQLKKHNHADVASLHQYLSSYRQSGILATLENFLVDSKFIENSLLLDPTGKREANIYKFVSNLKESLRADDFLLNDYLSAQFSSFQEDLSSNLNESMALFSGNRVSIMTIHGSKGLQFKHVLLAGIGALPKKTKQVQFMFDSDSSLYSIAILNAEMKLSWSAWGKEQKALLNDRENLEYERLFYVAITRAEKSISFVADMAKTPASGSWYTKLSWPSEGSFDLNGYKIESLQYPVEVSPLEVIEKGKILLKDKLEFSSSKASDQEIAKLSITDLISTDRASSSANVQIANEKIIDNLNKAQKGTDLHRLFESTKYLSRSQVQAKSTADEKKALEWLFNLKEIPFQKILDDGHAEWGFGLATSLGTLQGQIDLWAKLGDRVYILDYKTGSSFFSEKALLQLQRYGECLKKMSFIQPEDFIELVVLYPFEEKIVQKSLKFADVGSI